MTTENTSLNHTTPAGDSNTTNGMVIRKINTYQKTFLIVAGSLLAMLVLIAVAGHSGGGGDQYLTVTEIAKGGASTLAEYQVDTTNSALAKDIFDGVETGDCPCGCCSCCCIVGCSWCCSF